MKTILVIEDEKLILESISDYLTDEGYLCLSASNGSNGIQIAKDKIPDLILCDIKMPGITGHQVLQNLRSDTRTSTIPFIFLSAMVNKDDIRKGMLLGADDYLTKPFRPEELLNAVRIRLEKYSELKRKIDVLKDSISHALPHELQTPLVTIIGYAEMLSDKFKDGEDEEVLEFSEAIHEAGIRLNRLIKNFIFYQKLEHMSANPQSIPTNNSHLELTSQMIEDICYKVAKRFDRQSDLVVTAEAVNINIPQTYFFLLIEELVDNAFKFSEQGTEVNVSGKRNSKQYKILVTDHGRGMTDEQMASIGAYLQFERGKYEQQGMGLGLTISKKIVEIYGGEIKTESKYGEFTKVVVSLPIGHN